MAFGGISVVLMVSRIQLSTGVYIDARSVPIALVGLFEGGLAVSIAALIAAAYRIWLGGTGMLGGIVSLALTAGAGALVYAWARRDGDVDPRHTFALSGLAFLASSVGFVLVPGGLALFQGVWLWLLVVDVVGIAFIARLMHDVVVQARLTGDQERFRAIIDEATDAIRIVDPETSRTLDCNRRDCEISGYTREEMIGRDAREFWPDDPELLAVREAAAAGARRTGVARLSGAGCRIRSGEVIRIDATWRTVEHGGRRYEIVIYRPSTEREAAEAARSESAQLRAVTLLAGAAAHEINNPLAVVVGSLGLLASRLPREGREASWVERATAAATRIQDIVTRMNRITRIEQVPATPDVPPMLDITKSSETSASEIRS